MLLLSSSSGGSFRRPRPHHLLLGMCVLLAFVPSQSVPNHVTSLHVVRSYAKATVDCMQWNATRVASFVNAQKETAEGYCLRKFDDDASCVDQLAFLYHCRFLDRTASYYETVGNFMIIGFFAIVCFLACCG